MEDLSTPPQARKRLQKDVMNTQDKTLTDLGIYYWSNEVNIRQGKAMIVGPKGTPYEGGLYVFSVVFPVDYPFSPPKVLFLTGDGYTRFHPNLYKEGKVCLSILGTWQGPSWTSTQSLSTVLISIQGLLDENPLANEPSFERGTLQVAAHKKYANAIEHQVCAYMVSQFLAYEQSPVKTPLWNEFEEVVRLNKQSLKASLRAKIQERAAAGEVSWNGLTYGMNIDSKWNDLLAKTAGWA
jgi:ubiquitin-conjugating enzyme E2 Z